MARSTQNIEQLAILNAWVTSAIVILNLFSTFVVLNVRSFESLASLVFVSGTVGGAASNYRRLQEAYIQHFSKSKPQIAPPTVELPVESRLDELSAAKETWVEKQEVVSSDSPLPEPAPSMAQRPMGAPPCSW
ncbi:MAG: hypothetical protein AAGC54_09955 [Cyanobacteria bacterium P01_F01_bin.4]